MPLRDRADTQDSAFRRARDGLTRTVREEVLDHLRLQGATCEEIEGWLGRPHQTVAAAVTGLRRQGVIHDSGERRPTRSGRAAIVWSYGPPPQGQTGPVAPSKREVVEAAAEALRAPTLGSVAALRRVLERALGEEVDDGITPLLTEACAPKDGLLY